MDKGGGGSILKTSTFPLLPIITSHAVKIFYSIYQVQMSLADGSESFFIVLRS